MGANSKISWTDHTFNPWIGCHKVSPGCKHCYAEAMVSRFGGDFGSPRVTSDSNWRQPIKWAKHAERRMRVFCASMGDVFEDLPELVEPRKRLCDLIDATAYNLDWLLLTKRPENFDLIPGDIRARCWMGVTVESEAQRTRAWKLLESPAMLHFVSVEPLIAPVDPDIANFCDWLIVGAESGRSCRPMQEGWVRAIRDQCQVARTPFFYKQAIIDGVKIECPMLDGRQWTEVP